MITDKLNTLSEDQAVTASAASTNTIDTEVDSSKIGDGNPKFFYFVVTTDFATLTSLTFEIEDAADDGAGAADTWADLATSQAVALADLVAGKEVKLAIPSGARRHLRAYYTVAGSNATAGKVSAYAGP